MAPNFQTEHRQKSANHATASQLSESNALSPFGGREPSAKVQLSYDRTCVKNVAGANSFDQMQRPGVKGPCAARNLFSIAHPPGKCNPRRGFGAGAQTGRLRLHFHRKIPLKKARHSGPLARCGVLFCVLAAGWYISCCRYGIIKGRRKQQERLTIKSQPQKMNGGGEKEMEQKRYSKAETLSGPCWIFE